MEQGNNTSPTSETAETASTVPNVAYGADQSESIDGDSIIDVPGTFQWTCACGEVVRQEVAEPDIRAKLLAHIDGEAK